MTLGQYRLLTAGGREGGMEGGREGGGGGREGEREGGREDKGRRKYRDREERKTIHLETPMLFWNVPR